MKIDELINELEQVKEEHGNLEVLKEEKFLGDISFRDFNPTVTKNSLDFMYIFDQKVDEDEKFIFI